MSESKQKKAVEQTFDSISEEQRATWSKEYYRQHYKEIQVPLIYGDEDEDENTKYARFCIKAPNRTTKKALSHYANKEDVDGLQKLIIKNCVLGGDMQYLKAYEDGGDEDVLQAVMTTISQLSAKKKATSIKYSKASK